MIKVEGKDGSADFLLYASVYSFPGSCPLLPSSSTCRLKMSAMGSKPLGMRLKSLYIRPKSNFCNVTTRENCMQCFGSAQAAMLAIALQHTYKDKKWQDQCTCNTCFKVHNFTVDGRRRREKVSFRPSLAGPESQRTDLVIPKQRCTS